MSEETVDIVRRICEAHARGDFKAAKKLQHRKMEIEIPGFPEAQLVSFTNYKDVAEFMRNYLEAYEDFSMTPIELIDVGEWVVAVVHVKGLRTGVPIERHPAEVWRVRDGKAVRLDVYHDRAEALKALGF